MSQPQKPPKEALPNIGYALRYIAAEIVQIIAKEKEQLEKNKPA
jgi:hypothetical protein